MAWFWGLLGWVLAASVVAWLHRRFDRQRPRYPAEVMAFVLKLETEIARTCRDVEFLGVLPDRFACLLRVDGQETPISLHDAYRHYQAFPDAFASMVKRLLQDVREVGLDRVGDRDFAAAAPLLLPQIRSHAWLQAQGCFGDSGIVYTKLNDELVTVYVLDDPMSMVFVCRAHLRSWRKSEVDVHNLAVANLARLGDLQLGDDGAWRGPMVVQTGDGYDAARVLLLAQAGDLLVAMPDRDTLWVGTEEGQNLEQLMATTEAIASKAAHPVSAQVWRLNAGQLEALRAPR
ncbi:MAG: hypothetical protein H6838_12110 [Planctomycetes bacterium]|nr:hypothetical protein [Planctomycetota bacterium]MCB9886232.1 hypothetical protein [Planctomycetota bacterium]